MNKQENDTKSDQTLPVPSDAEVAASLKQEIIEAYGPILKVMEKIVKLGFNANIQTAPLPTGQHIITTLIIAKHF